MTIDTRTLLPIAHHAINLAADIFRTKAPASSPPRATETWPPKADSAGSIPVTRSTCEGPGQDADPDSRLGHF